MNWKKKWALIVVVLGFTAMLGLTACSRDRTDNSIPEENTGNKGKTEESKFICPLDGAALESMPEGRPIAVIIDNLPRARPQSGLQNADLVFETLAEGGVTRLLAVYYHGQASKVGPIRSARPYFIDLASSVNGVLVHSGGSPEALKYMKNTPGFPHLDEFRYAGSFWRSRERRAPHNLYSSTDNLRLLSQKARFDSQANKISGFSFGALPEEASTETPENEPLMSNEIRIGFPKGFAVTYVYTPELNAYSRFVAGEAHVDELTNTQLRPKNIVVKFVKTSVIDGQGRLDMKLTGHGRALVFSGGTVTEALWQRNSVDQLTTFKTTNGRTVEFFPGQLWIEIVPETTKVTF